MLEENIKAAKKFNIDIRLIEKRADIKKNIEVLGNDLTFIGVREYKRTKHVHRLHPYLGKFIPQLVEVFLKKYFIKGDTILDPFSGSGTALIEGNVLGMNSVGIELSPFNVLIQKVKAKKYNSPEVEEEIKDALLQLKAFSRKLQGDKQLTFFEGKVTKFETDNEYLKTWFSDRALQEILFYRSIIKDYENQDILKIILSRSARSARLIPHYDLARPKKPVRGPYWCIKHKRVCVPIDEALKFINRYSWDTIKRIKEFNKIRTNAFIKVYQGDARNIKLPTDLKIDGIFTSPPYVGVIDYHEQHRYAYELFNFPRKDELEIGPARNGQSVNAKEAYQQGVSEVFKNVSRYLVDDAKIFVVANDKFNLYPEISRLCGFKLIDIFHRPVLMRTERDSNKYFESIFYFKKG
ncbi:MAG: DNA methyltransferase [Candidatus Aerophobetes bacterium]|nr:DNA methyltransferase [Candidatus Aerophobetes bacterium]